LSVPLKLPRPGIRSASTIAELVDHGLPAIIVIANGTEGEPVKNADWTYQATFRIHLPRGRARPQELREPNLALVLHQCYDPGPTESRGQGSPSAGRSVSGRAPAIATIRWRSSHRAFHERFEGVERVH
jgi:UDP-N-acetylglucosamine:LPS N-acetylglucosamine transferase